MHATLSLAAVLAALAALAPARARARARPPDEQPLLPAKSWRLHVIDL